MEHKTVSQEQKTAPKDADLDLDNSFNRLQAKTDALASEVEKLDTKSIRHVADEVDFLLPCFPDIVGSLNTYIVCSRLVDPMTGYAQNLEDTQNALDNYIDTTKFFLKRLQEIRGKLDSLRGDAWAFSDALDTKHAAECEKMIAKYSDPKYTVYSVSTPQYDKSVIFVHAGGIEFICITDAIKSIKVKKLANGVPIKFNLIISISEQCRPGNRLSVTFEKDIAISGISMDSYRRQHNWDIESYRGADDIGELFN